VPDLFSACAENKSGTFSGAILVGRPGPGRKALATRRGEHMKIDIVSDHVCPWCYIGKRRLDRALAQRPEIEAEITWLPFQLSPDMPREGRDRREHYAEIFGAERAQEIMANMAKTAAADGLEFEVKPGARSPNTLPAHVLVHWAQQTPGVDANALIEKLFAAHHTASEDIGDPQVLARIAGEVGMDSAKVLERLAARTDEDAVRRLIDQAREAGVTGVPFFIFDRRYALSGAQPPEAILEVIDELTAETAQG
jgi:predicted DsbA family dithiol-disulfide isomerase